MEEMNVTIAKALLSIKAVFFRPEEPFIWASGIKSPVYCDNRLILTAPGVRSEVEKALARTVKREYPEAEVLMGTSTAGIAHAAIAAEILGLPMGYVRGGKKDHGRKNQIEGRLEKGQKVVVVEDLISTGGSVLEVVEVLREAGAEVLGGGQHLHLWHEKGPGTVERGEGTECKPDGFRHHSKSCRRGRLCEQRGCKKTDCLPGQPFG